MEGGQGLTGGRGRFWRGGGRARSNRVSGVEGSPRIVGVNNMGPRLFQHQWQCVWFSPACVCSHKCGWSYLIQHHIADQGRSWLCQHRRDTSRGTEHGGVAANVTRGAEAVSLQHGGN